MSLQHIQLRPKEPKESPLKKALSKPSYTSGGNPGIYAGPTSSFEDKPKSSSSVRSAPLAQALSGPATGSAPDFQAEAWARREEIVAANKAKLDAQADALYGSIQGLSKEDQDFILSKAAGKSTSAEALGKALGAAPGVVSATSVGKDPLLQTLIDKNYVKQTKDGYAWMLPEVKKEIKATKDWIDESGWTHITKMDTEGNLEDETIGREAKEIIDNSLSPSESLSVQKYIDEIEGRPKEQSDKNMDKAITMAGTRLGIGEKDSNGKKWTQERDDMWKKAVMSNKAYLDEVYNDAPSIPTDDLSLDTIPNTSPDVASRKQEVALAKSRVEGRPEIISEMQKTLGLPVDGLWSPQLEYMLYQYGTGGQ